MAKLADDGWVMDSIPHLIWSARPDGWLDFFSRSFLQYSGQDAGRLQGWGWTRLLHPDDMGLCLAGWQAALATAGRYEAQYRLRRADGVYRLHRTVALQRRDADGRSFRWYGTTVESDSRDPCGAPVPDAMANGESPFMKFVENTVAAAWIKDARLRYVYVNPGYERLTGKRRGELMGREDFEVWPHEVARQFRGNDEEVLRLGRAVHTLESSGDGPDRLWDVVKFPFHYDAGGVGVAGTSVLVSGGRPAAAGAGIGASFGGCLTRREREVLELVVQGRARSDIAARLGVSPKTVDTYRGRVMIKLRVRSVAGLVRIAVQSGLARS